MKNRSAYNYAIDFWKIIFCLLIVLFHCTDFGAPETVWFSAGGHIGVEFFFLVSGFLMNQSVRRKETENDDEALGAATLKFLYRKFARITPYVWTAFVIVFLEKTWFGKNSIYTIIQNALLSVWELLYLRMAGLTEGAKGINEPTWYLSAMFLTMAVIYPLMRKNRELFCRVIAPAASIFIMGYLVQTYGTIIRSIGEYTYGSLFGLKRAIAEVCLGCFGYEISYALSKKNYTDFGMVLLTAAEMCGYGFAIAGAWYSWDWELSPVVLLALLAAVSITFSRKSYVAQALNQLLRNDWMNKLSISMFISNYETVILFRYYWEILQLHCSIRIIIILYLLCNAAVSVLHIIVIENLRKVITIKKIRDMIIAEEAA